MQLLSCHIEGYGKIIDKDFSFQENITEILASNGYGKSTMASFIKAMFYGLKSVTATTKDFLDRSHYYPFDGNRFGGNIVFKMQDDVYKVERFFDKKSSSKDSINVYKNGNLSRELADNLGMKVFGFDQDTFERILFINADAITLSTTTDINRKLNNVIDDVDEDFTLDKALKELKEKTVKAKDITVQELLVKRLQDEIVDLEKVQQNLGDKYQQLNELNRKIAEFNKQMIESNKVNDLIKNWHIHDEIVREIDGLEAEKSQINEKYPNGIPSDEEVSEINDAITEIIKLNEINPNYMMSFLEKEKLAQYRLAFKDSSVDDIVHRLELMTIKNYELENKNSALTDCNNAQVDISFEDIFGKNELPKAKIDQLDQLVIKYRADKERLLESATISTTKSVFTKVFRDSTKAYLIGAIVSLLVIAIGISMLFFAPVVTGIITIITGALFLAFVGFAYLIYLIKNNSVMLEKRKNEGILEEDAKEIKSIISPYGYVNSDCCLACEQFKQDYQAYLSSKALREKSVDDSSLLEESVDKLKRELDEFFQNFQVSGISYSDKLNALKKMLNDYQNLLQKEDNYLILQNINEEKKQSQQKVIDAFNEKYLLTASKELMKEISRDIHNISVYARQLAGEKVKLANHDKKYQLENRPDDMQIIDVDSIASALNKCLEHKSHLETEIADDERRIETIEDKQNKILDITDTIAEMKNRRFIFQATEKALKEAEQHQKDKYAKPVKDRFMFYAKMIKEVIGDKILMDRDYRITYEKKGEQRPIEHLSSGEFGVCALCFRLALIDNMYDFDQPFIILDDPFVNLDNEYMQKVRDLLQHIAKERQIVYFCCHDSRSIL